MRLVLHIGTGKTGTTTVQQTFRRHSSTLLAAGVLYPTQHGFPLMGHEALMCLSGIDPVRMPREFNDVRQLGRIELVRMTDEFWRSIKTEIDATSPEVVVLSYVSSAAPL